MTRWRSRILPILLVAACVLSFAAAVRPQGDGSLQDKIDKQKKQLETIQKDIERHRAKSAELEREKKSVAKELSAIDKDISLSKRLIASLEERERLLEEQIGGLRTSIKYEEEMLTQKRRRLGTRLREMYKRQRIGGWQVLFASSDIHELLRRYKFETLMAERDAALVEDVVERKRTLEAEQAGLTEAMVDVVQAKQDRVEEGRRFDRNKSQRLSMLKRIRTEASQHAAAIEELKQSQEKLKDLIAGLEQQRLSAGAVPVPDVDFAALKGRMIRPVEGRITKRYGNERHPKFGTVTFNNGVNIAAAAGSPIRAVAAGRVEFVDWISGYGNCIILNHGDGYYTLYAHAAQILVRPGQTVRGGDVIAEVGDSGSLNGFECHFEIRKSKQALDPMKWFAP